MFAHAALFAAWYANHVALLPGETPGEDSGDMRNVITLFTVLGFVCVVFPLLWGLTARWARRASAVKAPTAVVTIVLQGFASLGAFPLALTLPYGWVDATALGLADLLALVAVVIVFQKDGGRFSRKAATPSAYSGERTASS
jgi:fumarate reductase subunit D